MHCYRMQRRELNKRESASRSYSGFYTTRNTNLFWACKRNVRLLCSGNQVVIARGFFQSLSLSLSLFFRSFPVKSFRFGAVASRERDVSLVYSSIACRCLVCGVCVCCDGVPVISSRILEWIHLVGLTLCECASMWAYRLCIKYLA